MASAGDRRAALEKTKSLLNELASVEPLSLARTDDLSKSMDFSESVPVLTQMVDIVRELNERDLSRLTTTHLNQIHTGCSHLKQVVDQIKSFTLEQNNPGNVRKSIVNTAIDMYDTVMDPLTLPLSFTATQATDYSRIEREAKGCHATMKEEAEKFTGFLDEAKSEASKALQAVRDQAAEAGVSTNAQIFLQESKVHARNAVKWLAGTIMMSIATLGVAIFFVKMSLELEPKSVPAAIQYTVSKLILLSTLSFTIFWCAKNYKAQKHNETLNKHRANALATFKAFVEGTDDQAVKDAVLLHAAQAAFSGRPTGFDSAEAEGHFVNPVIEVLGKTTARAQAS